jgi:hypothetical protein
MMAVETSSVVENIYQKHTFNMFGIEEIFDKMRDNRMAVFTTGLYNLNIIGVRSDNNMSGKWDDTLMVIYRNDSGAWITKTYDTFTTDPGTTELLNPSFPNARKHGTAIMKEGQYRGAYKLGFHIRRNHPALVQIGDVHLYRDNNRDAILNYNVPIHKGNWFGINIHSTRPGWNDPNIYNWSAGCQVQMKWEKHMDFINLCRYSSRYWGDIFTYSLLHENEFKK